MRHHKSGRIFGRVKKVRVALVRSLARALIVHDAIETTEAKAKELRPFIEKLVTMGKNANLASYRIIVSRLGGALGAKKLFETTSPKYKDRSGGYTRITKLGRRKADGTPMARIEFV
ncbi:MAG: 50S ribosomal protein L17 [Candidatus Taylorbacteria bacterium RIFCSPHIGHO2_01_FULL_45_63]|uniref:50S ribosomal protein L17 n=1 Tax=Candidatus Taylorbacteria bacterium RIFCSPHIGHO2_02_FULL_45_35 TaxID=1802311 RepID=A0A1G2MQS4_9BACT|nr:MAG: 50S ribosomal protein L17 [Candidatus Taylorbacteria bacterium RIFCSPHIGHO2_01_FULL_45_63]OHA26215.1 MAG: 50S ribosomal protein L17 [Candidatus Taylorbacteria bacterium RIFCSPHIGHO2_02_FULL_45_35]OHA32555.1 MAG: 50S ribosomal protein L17 [Candidatus Taylorbacteria bacterium RIFCSPLOWO2_01_FULL_45_34b]